LRQTVYIIGFVMYRFWPGKLGVEKFHAVYVMPRPHMGATRNFLHSSVKYGFA